MAKDAGMRMRALREIAAELCAAILPAATALRGETGLLHLVTVRAVARGRACPPGVEPGPRVGDRIAEQEAEEVPAEPVDVGHEPFVHARHRLHPLAGAVARELASSVSFVIVFRLFFDRVARRDARALAWTEMASGALLPGGGAGGLAIGGWLMHLTGAPTRWIVRRSSGLFFLTSAVNGSQRGSTWSKS